MTSRMTAAKETTVLWVSIRDLHGEKNGQIKVGGRLAETGC